VGGLATQKGRCAVSVSELAHDQITIDPRQTRVEELDEPKVEGLQWLGRQLIWEQTLENLHIRAAAERRDRTSPVSD
jgi:hypothetical protein